MTRSSLLAVLAFIVIATAIGFETLAQGHVDTSFINANIYVRNGYVFCAYNVSFPRAGTYSCPFPYDSFVVSIEAEVGCDVSLSSGVLTLTAKSRNASFVIVLYDLMVHIDNAINVSIPIILSFNELPSQVIASVYFTTSEFTIKCEYPVEVREMSAHLNLTHVEPGSVTEVKATLYRTGSDWVVIKQIMRSVEVESYNEALVRDYYEFENVGLDKCDVITLRLPANATILGVEGAIFKYTKGVGSGRYFISTEEKYTSLTVYLIAPPGPGEKVEIKVTYKAPVIRTDSGYSLSLLMNPGYLVVNSSVEVKVPGKAEFKEPPPLNVSEKGGYHIGVFKVKAERTLSNTDEIIVELNINSFKLTWDRIRPYLIVAVSAIIIFSSGLLIRSKLLKAPRVKKVHRPELSELMHKYIGSLEEEKEARFEFARRAISRRIYRHRVELAKSKQREIRKKISEVKERETRSDVISMIDEFYKLDKEAREMLSRIVRARKAERDELLARVESVIKKMRELASALE